MTLQAIRLIASVGIAISLLSVTSGTVGAAADQVGQVTEETMLAAQRYLQEGRALFDHGAYDRAASAYAKGITIFERSGEPELSDLTDGTVQRYLDLLSGYVVSLDQAASLLCLEGFERRDRALFEEAEPYVRTELDFLKKLSTHADLDQELVEILNRVAPQTHEGESFLDHYLASAYFNLGLIARVRGDVASAEEIVDELHTLGRSDVAEALPTVSGQELLARWRELL